MRERGDLGWLKLNRHEFIGLGAGTIAALFIGCRFYDNRAEKAHFLRLSQKLLFPRTGGLVEKFDDEVKVLKQSVKLQKGFGFSLNQVVSRSLNYQEEIEDAASKMNFVKESIYPPLLPALIMVESGGNKEADSGLAKGLCQLKEETASDMLKYLKAEDSAVLDDLRFKYHPQSGAYSADLFHSKTNIALALRYFDILSSLFHDPGITFWSYHLGIGNMKEGVETYLREVLDEDLTASLNLSDPREITSPYLIRTRGINFKKLISERAVLDKLENIGALEDETTDYVYKIVAASRILAGIR